MYVEADNIFLVFFLFFFKFCSTVFYGQYKCYGPGAVTSKRVKWARNLTSVEAEPFMTKDSIDGKTWIRPVPTSFRKAFNAGNH